MKLATLLLVKEQKEVGVDYEGSCIDGYFGNEADFHWLHCLHFLLLLSLLALHHFDHVL